MGAEQLKKRTQGFARSTIKLVEAIPDRGPARIICQQLIRCGTSVGANFRAACRARSHPDFIAKLKIVEEECDESIYWMELMESLGIGNVNLLQQVNREANEILSIIVASIKTARKSS